MKWLLPAPARPMSITTGVRSLIAAIASVTAGSGRGAGIDMRFLYRDALECAKLRLEE